MTNEQEAKLVEFILNEAVVRAGDSASDLKNRMSIIRCDAIRLKALLVEPATPAPKAS